MLAPFRNSEGAEPKCGALILGRSHYASFFYHMLHSLGGYRRYRPVSPEQLLSSLTPLSLGSKIRYCLAVQAAEAGQEQRRAGEHAERQDEDW